MDDQKVILRFSERKKHSVRFDNKDSKVLKSVYLMNAAFKELGEPKAITIVVKREDEG